MMSSFDWLDDQLAEREREGLLRRRREFRPLSGGRCEVDGRTLWNFAGNDYLNLASDPRVIAAAQAALAESGCGARGSALVCGRTHWQCRLEERLAQFEGSPAIVFPTGMAANVGTLSALMGRGDVVFCDRLNHASLVDGCRLSGATLKVYRNDDLADLERHLRNVQTTGRRFLVTDTVFSMDGDLAPLPELCNLAERHDALLIVDEAHATGVFGDRGRGVCEHFDVEDRVPVRVGTLSKALGGLGGFVIGSQTLIDFLWNTARTQMFSTALPPAVCSAAIAAIDVLDSEPDRPRELQRRCAAFRARLQHLGVEPLPQSTGPIVPIVCGEPARTVDLARQLEERGYLVGAIRPPTVPRGTSRLRISLSLAHDDATLEQFAEVLGELWTSSRDVGAAE